MTIIRGEMVRAVSLLTVTGELLPIQSTEISSLVEKDVEHAFQQGEERGEKKGYAKALEESKFFLSLLQTMTRKMLDHKNRLLDQLKPEIIEFSLAVCEKVIRKELTHPEIFVHLINALLNQSARTLGNETLHIILSPADFHLLEKQFSLIHYDKQEIAGLRFFSDPFIRQGDCRIEAKSGLLNYDISRELEEIQANVLQR